MNMWRAPATALPRKEIILWPLLLVEGLGIDRTASRSGRSPPHLTADSFDESPLPEAMEKRRRG
ncbi:hypothetical protein E2562_001952 [Oryza meyeriana var. granulata]|uniref:Uncharacterized protein n=1 Tax=Oryza meyeriana var. granulata TaxID=110450 RepID=A0A6G1C353_9ORYZ|nr:hypothetical protein E2562_001952 [Oryza meyeriana var. granulata]